MEKKPIRQIGRVFYEGKMYYPDSKEILMGLGGTIFKYSGGGSIGAGSLKDITKEAIFDRFVDTTSRKGDDNSLDIYENDIVLGGRCAALVRMDYDGHTTFKYRVEKEVKTAIADYNKETTELPDKDDKDYNKLARQEFNIEMFWKHPVSGDFPSITKILGNNHQSPELMETIKHNPQPYPEEKKVEFINFSLPENENMDFKVDGFTAMLIEQEIGMYHSLGKDIEQDDFDWLCQRRGFNVNEKNFLAKVMRKHPIGKNLEFDTTHESIKQV